MELKNQPHLLYLRYLKYLLNHLYLPVLNFRLILLNQQNQKYLMLLKYRQLL
jgi:hypothetical protein